jgi:hypothetical protein
MDALKDYPLPLPPMEEQLRLSMHFDNAEVFCGQIQSQAARLREIINRILE